MNDKLREALEKARKWHNGDKWRNGNAEERAAWEAHRDLLDEALAASKQEPHKVLCHAEGDRCLGCDHYHGKASVCSYAKPEPQAQAGDPEVVGWIRLWAFNKEKPKKEKNERGRLAWPTKFKFLPVTQGQCARDDLALITLQSHREAMSKLQARIDELEQGLDSCGWGG